MLLNLTAMFGLMENGGMEWNGMVWNTVRFHCLVLYKMDGMEWNVMEPIPSNTTHSFNFSFLSNWGVCNGMEYINKSITILSLFFLFHKPLLLPSFLLFTISSSSSVHVHPFFCNSSPSVVG